MFYAMGPVHNREFDEEIDNADRMSQRESESRCTTPDHDSQCLQSPRSTFSCPGVIEHDSDRHRTDAWMGYPSGIWPRQHDIYPSHQPRPHSLSLQQQSGAQQQHQQLSTTSTWHTTTTMTRSSAGSGTAYNKTPSVETSDDFSRPSSTNQCDSQTRHRNAPRMLPTTSHNGLVDLRDLTGPIDMVSGTNCIPLSEKCIKYSLSMQLSGSGDGHNGSVMNLKRKLPLSLRKSESSSGKKSSDLSDEARAEKRRRFTRTTEALKKLGLWEVAIRTGKMIVQNRQLQKDLDQLRQDSRQLMLSVLKNPENENLKKALVTMQARIKAHKHQSFHGSNVSVQS